MPKYTFQCDRCKKSVQLYCQLHSKALCNDCNIDMTMRMPLISVPEVRETIDKNTNSQWKQNQTEILRERKADYFWEVEVPRLVNSGIYSLETMLENQWVFYDEKNNLQTRNTPPQKQ